MTENDGEKVAEVVGRYGKEYSRLRRLTSNLDVIQQSVGIYLFGLKMKVPKKFFLPLHTTPLADL